jgi:tetratricopeptide (TPR) repeat protein
VKDTVSSLLDECNSHFLLKRYDDAIKCYDKAIELAPDYPEPYRNKGNALSELKRYDDAIKCYDKAIELAPNYPEPYRNKGNAYYDLKQYNDAIKCYDKAIELAPDDPKPYRNKADVYYYLLQYNKAIKCIDKAIELAPNYPLTYNLKGVILYFLGMYSDAIKCYDKAIEIDQINPYFHLNKGLALFQFGNSKSALSCFDKAIELAPKESNAYNNKGRCFLRLKEYSQAMKYFDKAIELDSKAAVYYYNKGLSLFLNKNYQESLIYFDKAISLKQDYMDAYRFKSSALLKLGRYDESIEPSDKIKDLNPYSTYASVSDPPQSLISLILHQPEARVLSEFLGNFLESLLPGILGHIKEIVDKHIPKISDILLSVVSNKLSEKILKIAADNAKKKEEKIYELIIEAQIDLSYRSILSANNISNEILKLDPDNSDALLIKGVANYIEKNFKDAFRFLNEAIEKDSSNFSAYRWKGIVLHDIGETDIASNYYRHAIRIIQEQLTKDNSNNKLRIELIRSYLLLLDFESALYCSDEGLKLNQDDYLLLREKGKILYLKNMNLSAIKCFKNASKLYPLNAISLVYLGKCYKNLLDYPQAMRYFTKAIKKNSLNYDAWKGKIKCLTILGKHKRLVKTARRSLIINGNSEYKNEFALSDFIIDNFISIKDYENAIYFINLSLNIDILNPARWRAIEAKFKVLDLFGRADQCRDNIEHLRQLNKDRHKKKIGRVVYCHLCYRLLNRKHILSWRKLDDAPKRPKLRWKMRYGVNLCGICYHEVGNNYKECKNKCSNCARICIYSKKDLKLDSFNNGILCKQCHDELIVHFGV